MTEEVVNIESEETVSQEIENPETEVTPSEEVAEEDIVLGEFEIDETVSNETPVLFAARAVIIQLLLKMETGIIMQIMVLVHT